MIKILKPIVDKSSYSDPIEESITTLLWATIFYPLFQILGLKVSKRVNSINDLRNEFRSGRIYYWDGYVYGIFNANIGKSLRAIGATFDSRKKAYKLHMSLIPNELRTDIVLGKAINKNKTDEVLKHLEEIEKTKLILGSGDQAVSIIDSLNLQAIRSFKVLPESLQLPYDLNEKSKEQLLNSYQIGLEASIGDWKMEAIERLRKKTQENALMGYRSDRLASVIKNEFGVSQNKSKFLARQETARFVAQYREQRYTEAGLRDYIWSTSNDERVRPDHRELDGKKFSYKEPPIVNRTTGRKANPGEDWNCRCMAMPVLRIGA